MRWVLASLLMAIGPFPVVATEAPFACNMKALSKSERAEYQKVMGRLWETAEAREELGDGYAFRFPSTMLTTAAKWVSLEMKCCPFFAFEIEVVANGGPVWLRITGAKGVKEFIREELGLDS